MGRVEGFNFKYTLSIWCMGLLLGYTTTYLLLRDAVLYQEHNDYHIDFTSIHYVLGLFTNSLELIRINVEKIGLIVVGFD